MTTEQMERIERPLAEVDEVATRIQETDSAAPRSALEDGIERARELVGRVLQEPAWRYAIVLTIIAVVVTNVIVMARPRPRSREEIVLDRSREALDRSRETLDRVLEQMAAALDR